MVIPVSPKRHSKTKQKPSTLPWGPPMACSHGKPRISIPSPRRPFDKGSAQMDSQSLVKQDKLEYTLQTMHDHPRILTKIGLSPSAIFPSKLSTKSISPQTKQHIFKLTFNMLQKTQLNPIHQYKNSSTILLMVEKSC